jgi:hypothetical protein
VVTILRPLSTSELLDRTFHLYRNNFLLFIGIAALPQLFVLALHFVDSALWLRRLIDNQVLRTWLFVIASFLAVEVAHAGTVIAVSNLHLARITGIYAAYASAKSSFLRVIGIGSFAFWVPLVLAIILGALAVGLAEFIFEGTGLVDGAGTAEWVRVVAVIGVFLVGPLLALRWWLAWALVIPVTVIEGGGFRTTLRRSRSLTTGRRGRIFITYALVALLTWVVSILCQTPFYSMVEWRIFRPHHASSMAIVVSALGQFVSTSLVGPLMTIAFTLIYYDERVRREGFDLQLMMSTLENASLSSTPVLAS